MTRILSLLLLGVMSGAGHTAEDVECAECVETQEIANRAVTSQKLDNRAVTTPKLGTRSVTTRTLAPHAVAKNKIADGAVTTTKLRDASITPEKLAPELAAALEQPAVLDLTTLPVVITEPGYYVLDRDWDLGTVIGPDEIIDIQADSVVVDLRGFLIRAREDGTPTTVVRIQGGWATLHNGRVFIENRPS